MLRRVLLSLLLVATAATQTADKPITVFAASSLTNVLEEIGKDYTAATGITVRISAAASSAL